MSPMSGAGSSAATQAQLEQIDNEKQQKMVKEAKRSAKNEETTAIASRIKTLRFA